MLRVMESCLVIVAMAGRVTVFVAMPVIMLAVMSMTVLFSVSVALAMFVLMIMRVVIMIVLMSVFMFVFHFSHPPFLLFYLPFAISSIKSHCSSLTFIIDNRERRTRSKLASFLLALTSASVTGRGNGFTASTSTTSSFGSFLLGSG